VNDAEAGSALAVTIIGAVTASPKSRRAAERS
jgi:hypothetical protein